MSLVGGVPITCDGYKNTLVFPTFSIGFTRYRDTTIFYDPPVNGGVIHLHPTFLHEFFDMARAQRVRHIPADSHENNLWGETGPFEIDRHRRSPS